MDLDVQPYDLVDNTLIVDIPLVKVAQHSWGIASVASVEARTKTTTSQLSQKILVSIEHERGFLSLTLFVFCEDH